MSRTYLPLVGLLLFPTLNLCAQESPGQKRLHQAANQGNAGAEMLLGVSYRNGQYERKDLKQAMKWFREAAAQGQPDAENSLGQMYEDGEGVKQSYALAAQWYRKAAEHVPDLGGAGQGRNNLGLLYMQGLGVPQDYIQAYMWFALAHNEVDLKEVQSRMTPMQILEAQRLAEDWKQKHSSP